VIGRHPSHARPHRMHLQQNLALSRCRRPQRQRRWQLRRGPQPCSSSNLVLKRNDVHWPCESSLYALRIVALSGQFCVPIVDIKKSRRSLW